MEQWKQMKWIMEMPHIVHFLAHNDTCFWFYIYNIKFCHVACVTVYIRYIILGLLINSQS